MSLALSELVSRLVADVPARGGVPTTSQYEQAVKDAVSDLGRRAPLRKRGTLAIQSGTASYDLPAGFVRLLTLPWPISQDGVLNTSSGLIPLGQPIKERHAIAAGTITFYPTPQYTLERELWYAATYVLDDEEVYQDLQENAARVALLKATALALLKKASSAADQAVKIEEANEDLVDKTGVERALRAQAQDYLNQYENELKKLIGAVGRRG